jgi:hypothetical protein
VNELMRESHNGMTRKAAWAALLLPALTLFILPPRAPAAGRQPEAAGVKRQEKSDDDFLDLTKYALPAREAVSEEQTAAGAVEVVGGTGVRKAELPIKITLLSLDRESYTLGDKGFFDIALENIGKEPVLIPWSPDPRIGTPSQGTAVPGNLHAVISLLAGRTAATGERVDTFGLYGSEFVHGSLKRLEPGRKVRIRVPFTWQFFDEETPARLLKRPAQRLIVRAQIILNSSKPITPLPAGSANGLTVELKKQ